MKNRTLFELTEEALALDELIDEVDGDLTDPRVCAVVDEWVAEITAATSDKADAYAALISELLARAEWARVEARRQEARARAFEGRANGLKARLLQHLDATGQAKIVGQRFTVRAQNAGGKRALELRVPVEMLEPEFTRTIVEPDNDKIRAALDEGQDLPFAVYKPRARTLVIV